MKYANPSSFCNQFRAELIQDLGLMEKLCCPLCVITYVNGDYEGCCFFDGAELNCVFEYAEPVEKVVGYWVEAVLKEMSGVDDGGVLLAKWTQLLTKS